MLDPERAKKIKEHVRKVPCFSCLVRPLCVSFLNDGQGLIENKCSEFIDWQVERAEILSTTDLEKDDQEERSKLIRGEILKILAEEKE
jgi:hypothetical protein